MFFSRKNLKIDLEKQTFKNDENVLRKLSPGKNCISFKVKHEKIRIPLLTEKKK